MQKLLTFFSKNISIYAIFNYQSFDDMLTNNTVCFEEQGPDNYKTQWYTCNNRHTYVQTRTARVYVLSFTGGSNAGGGRINTPPPEAAMPKAEEKTNLLVNRLED